MPSACQEKGGAFLSFFISGNIASGKAVIRLGLDRDIKIGFSAKIFEP